VRDGGVTVPDQQGSLQDEREAFDDPAGAQLDRRVSVSAFFTCWAAVSSRTAYPAPERGR
jgi:hypothetical protein